MRALLLAIALLSLAAPAQAAFPGQNGRIAFSSAVDGDSEIYSINPDGSGVLKLTNNTVNDSFPGWSPDGKKITFTRGGGIYTMNADGGGQTPIFQYTGYFLSTPSWSPDAQKIVFSLGDEHCTAPPAPPTDGGGLFTGNADGSSAENIECVTEPSSECCASWSPDGKSIAFTAGIEQSDIWVRTQHSQFFTTRTNVTASSATNESGPDWSPNAQKIIFNTATDLLTMNPDGSAQAPLRAGTAGVFSPDGAKIAFLFAGPPSGVWTANADGTGAIFLTQGTNPDWQPIPINSYPRPKGATPLRASLTTGYEPCTSPDRTHGPPLAYPSCSTLQMTSDYLTVGTGDSNQRPARNEGSLLLRVLPGTPGGINDADIGIEVFMDDVFTKTLADYTGELRVRVIRQITDKDNTPSPGGPGAATTVPIPLEVTARCTATADTQEGSVCTANTSVNVLSPDSAIEGRRVIWGLGRVEVYDGGADGDAQTPAGDTLFATQGLFVP